MIIQIYTHITFSDKQISELQETLESIYRKMLQHFPLSPLQRSTRIPFEMFNAPLQIREDLGFKRKTKQSVTENKYKDIIDPSDLFEVDGRPAETIYMLGEAGRGKTGQCYQLVQHWVEAMEASQNNQELTKWQKSLLVFDLLCFVTLRHVEKKIHSVVEMICYSVLKHYRKYHAIIRQILTGNPQKCKCLIILDGLDEIEQEIDIDVDISSCTVLMASRHWKFYYLSPDINDRDKVVEVCGLDPLGVELVIKKILINYFEMKNDSIELESEYRKISDKIWSTKFYNIIHIPLLLTALVHLWQTKTFTELSMTGFYVSLLNLLIKMSLKNKRVRITGNFSVQDIKKNYDIPNLMKKQRNLKEYFEILIILGKVGYNDLVEVAHNKKNGDDKNQQRGSIEMAQLVFEKDDLIEKVGNDVLTFALDVGILSEVSAPGSFDEENVSINFFHKTVEEFLTALYIVCSNDVDIDSFLLSCSSLKSLLEQSNVLMFLVGLAPKMGSRVSEMFTKAADSDMNVTKYRQMDEKFDIKCHATVHHLFTTLRDFYQEVKYSQIQTQSNLATNIDVCISDLYLHKYMDEASMALANELLSQVNRGIVSLRMDSLCGIFCNKSIPFKAIKTFLDNTVSLQALQLDFFRDVIPHTLVSVGPIFSSLTVLSLSNILLTTGAARSFEKAILSNNKICNLNLANVFCTAIEHNEFDVAIFWKIASSLSSEIQSLIPDDNCIKIDLRKGVQLRILHLGGPVLLGDITPCRFVITIYLWDVRVQNRDMLLAALSSFTQLKELTLCRLTFSSGKKDKPILNLRACRHLSELHISETYVDDIHINHSSLKNINIANMPGSRLQGILLELPECQNLKKLCIEKADEHDTMKIVFPKLTQVKEMRYTGPPVRNMTISFNVLRYAPVAQAIAKMTGLHTLDICQIDMGNLPLKLTPLMTQIKSVTLTWVDMTPSNWIEFITSLLTIQHKFDIDLRNTNIDIKSISVVKSFPHFKVSSCMAKDNITSSGVVTNKHALLRFSKV